MEAVWLFLVPFLLLLGAAAFIGIVVIAGNRFIRYLESRHWRIKYQNHPYRLQLIEDVESQLRILRHTPPTPEIQERIKKGEHLLYTLNVGGEEAVAALNAASTDDLFSTVFANIQAQEELGLLVRRN